MPSTKRLLAITLPILLLSSACHAGPAATTTRVHTGPRSGVTHSNGNSGNSGGAMHIDDNPYEGSTGSASGQTGALNNDGPAPGVQSYGIEDNPYEGSRSFGGGGMSSGNDAGSEPAPGAQSEGVNSYSDGAGNENNSQDISTNSTSDQDQEDQESGGGDDDPDTGEMPNPEDSHGGGNPWSRQVNRGQIKNVREYTPADTSLKLNARIKGYTPPDLGRVQKAEPSARQ